MGFITSQDSLVLRPGDAYLVTQDDLGRLIRVEGPATPEPKTRDEDPAPKPRRAPNGSVNRNLPRDPEALHRLTQKLLWSLTDAGAKGMSMRDMCNSAGINAGGNVTAVLAHLEVRGLVKDMAGTRGDRRRVAQWYLTNAGLDALDSGFDPDNAQKEEK